MHAIRFLDMYRFALNHQRHNQRYLDNEEKMRIYSDRVGGAVGAPASVLYSLPDTSGVLAASRAGTGDLYAQVVVGIGMDGIGIDGIGGYWCGWYWWLLVVLVLVVLVFLTQAEFYFEIVFGNR